MTIFKFLDDKITSQLCQPVVTSVNLETSDIEVDFAYSLIVNNREVLLTESELEYMLDSVRDLKEGDE